MTKKTKQNSQLLNFFCEILLSRNTTTVLFINGFPSSVLYFLCSKCHLEKFAVFELYVNIFFSKTAILDSIYWQANPEK